MTQLQNVNYIARLRAPILSSVVHNWRKHRVIDRNGTVVGAPSEIFRRIMFYRHLRVT